MILESLIGTALGGILRLVPHVLDRLDRRNERSHEFRMAELSARAASAEWANRMEAAKVQAGAMLDAASLQALIEGAKAQAKPTGIRWVDALSATVRPIVTYWWMALYSTVKAAMLTLAFAYSDGVAEALVSIWSANDAGVLSSILAFWFLDRRLARMENR